MQRQGIVTATRSTQIRCTSATRDGVRVDALDYVDIVGVDVLANSDLDGDSDQRIRGESGFRRNLETSPEMRC